MKAQAQGRAADHYSSDNYPTRNRQRLCAPVSVMCKYDHKARQMTLLKLLYDGVEYRIVKLGMHYIEREGRTLRHVFCVNGESMFFKLVLDAETLQWTCEEIRNYAGDAVE